MGNMEALQAYIAYNGTSADEALIARVKSALGGESLDALLELVLMADRWAHTSVGMRCVEVMATGGGLQGASEADRHRPVFGVGDATGDATSLFGSEESDPGRLVSIVDVARSYGTAQTRALDMVKGFEGEVLYIDDSTRLTPLAQGIVTIEDLESGAAYEFNPISEVAALVRMGISKGLSGALGMGQLLWASGPLERFLPLMTHGEVQCALQMVLKQPLSFWNESVAVEYDLAYVERDIENSHKVVIIGLAGEAPNSTIDFSGDSQRLLMPELGVYSVSRTHAMFVSYVTGKAYSIKFPTVGEALETQNSEMNERFSGSYYYSMWAGLFPYLALLGGVLIGKQFRTHAMPYKPAGTDNSMEDMVADAGAISQWCRRISNRIL